MMPPSENATDLSQITRAAQWLADGQAEVPNGNLKPSLPEIANRFGLPDVGAAEPFLLAGNYSICRRAFG